MIGLIVTTASILFTNSSEPWTLSPAFAKGDVSHNLTIDVDAGGQAITAEMVLKRSIKSVEGEKVSGNISFTELTVDGNSMNEDLSFDANWGKRGQILSTTGEFEDGVRRMLAPFDFIFPESPINIGDKWKFKMEPKSDASLKSNYEFEVMATETVAGEETLKVLSKYSEEVGGGTSAKTTFWVNKKGSVLKFESSIDAWIVPMAGGAPVSAQLKGSLKK